MTKILLFSLGRHGGLPKYASLIASEMFKKDVALTCFCAWSSEHLISPSIKIPTYYNYATLIISSFLILPFLLLYLALLRLTRGKSIYYFPYVHTWTPAILLFSKITGCKSVVTFHDFTPHLGESSFLSRSILLISSRLAAKHVFLTEHVQMQAIAINKKIQETSAVIPHGIFPLDGLIQKNPENLNKGPCNFLFVGRISPYKGVELMIEAFAESGLNESKLVVAGKSNYTLKIENQPANVTLIDKYLTELEFSELINQADVIVLPYLEATQSGVVTLGIESATPMICTNVGGISEQVSETDVVFCNPSQESIANAFISINEYSMRHKLCRSLIGKKETLSWCKIADAIYSFSVS